MEQREKEVRKTIERLFSYPCLAAFKGLDREHETKTKEGISQESIYKG